MPRRLLVRAQLVMMIGLLVAASGAAAQTVRDATQEWWWEKDWWKDGKLAAVETHAVETHSTSYRNGDVEVPVVVLRPKGSGRYPGVLFVHGRRGFDELVELHARRLAARGFVVYAPDLFIGRLIPKMPIEHDYALEDDLDRAVDAMRKLPDIRGSKICTYSHTRGGYFTLKLAVTKQRQKKDIACYVSYYPHWQDPNAPEALQVYSYAPEIEQFEIPAMVFVGEEEQYQRKRAIESSVAALRMKNRPITYIVYPGVGRGFDFRPPNVRTFADDLASKDALQRAAAFMRTHLEH